MNNKASDATAKRRMPTEHDLQKVTLKVELVLPVQQDAHWQYVAERVYAAMWGEFSDLIENSRYLIDFNPVEVKVKKTETTRPALQITYDRLTALSPLGGRKILYSKFPESADKVEEYILEAEHQDGYDYWLDFVDAHSLCRDFNTYMNSAYGIDVL